MEGAYAYIQPIKENTLPRLVYDPKKIIRGPLWALSQHACKIYSCKTYCI
jgi:hypothetical protein